MNHLQARTLANLMDYARPLKHYEDDVDPDIHLHTPLRFVDGDSLECAFFSTTNGLDRFPEPFYIRPDGSVYTYDSDSDSEQDVRLADIRWVPSESHRHFWRLESRTRVAA